MVEQSTRNSVTIGQKITFFMLLVAAIPLSLNWYVNYSGNSQEIARQSAARLSNTAVDLARFIDVWVDMNVRMLRQNALNPDVKSMQAERQAPVLRNIVKTFDWNYLAFTVDIAGQNLARSDQEAPRFYGDRRYVQEVLEGKMLSTQVLVGKTSGLPALVMAVPAYSEFGRLNGVLAIAMTLTELSGEIADVRIGQTGRAFLLDEAGRVISHTSDEYTRTRRDLSQHPAFRAAGHSGVHQVAYLGEDGAEITASAVRTDNDWVLVVEQDTAEAFAAVDRANRVALLLLAITLVLVTVMSIAVSRRLTDPIRHLTRVAEAISRGNLNEEVRETLLDGLEEAARTAIARLGPSVRFAMDKLNQLSR